MPEMDGHDLCKNVRADERFLSLPFIFISSHTDLDEKITGYSVGADEYIGKPLTDPNELIFKTRNLLENKQQYEVLSKKLSDSFSTGMQAMTYSSHLGQILLFLQDATRLSSYPKIADRLFETTENLGLNAVVQFSTPKGNENFRKNGIVSPLEDNIMELAKKKGRFFDFETRTIVSYEKFSLLIKNMPVDNPENYGIIKDILGNLCNALETITEVMWSKELNEQKNDTMANANMALDEIEETISDIQHENTNVIEDMIDDIDESMLTLGLSDSQEENIRVITQNCLLRSKEVLKKADALKEAFKKVNITLTSETN